jgi:hypothetical protein
VKLRSDGVPSIYLIVATFPKKIPLLCNMTAGFRYERNIYVSIVAIDARRVSFVVVKHQKQQVPTSACLHANTPHTQQRTASCSVRHSCHGMRHSAITDVTEHRRSDVILAPKLRFL